MNNQSIEAFLAKIKGISSFQVTGYVTEIPRSRIDRLPMRFTVDDLTAVNDKLPLAINALLHMQAVDENYGPHDDERYILSGIPLRNTLHLWLGDKVLKTIDGDVVHYEILENFVADPLDTSAHVVKIKALVATVNSHTSDTGEIVNIVYGGDSCIVDVCPSWLEDTYPGWRQRYQVLAALGYSAFETLQQTLAKTTSVREVKLPADISFSDS